MTGSLNSDLLLALQHGDSFFPGGTQSFSWGLETLAADGAVTTADQVCDFVASQLQWRWNYTDRPVIAACWRTEFGGGKVCALDAIVEARSLSLESRECSKRAGAALLTLHARLGSIAAKQFRKRVLAGEAHGHNAVAQGTVWRALGMQRSQAELMAAHQLRTQLTSAALRLGIIGHIDAQRIIGEQRRIIEKLLSEEAVCVDRIGTFTPQIEIAMMRHEAQESRLFAN